MPGSSPDGEDLEELALEFDSLTLADLWLL